MRAGPVIALLCCVAVAGSMSGSAQPSNRLQPWQEHNGSTIVHVLDLTSRKAHTAVTPAKGGFMRLTGPIEFKTDT
jgi:hypothetical protein